MTPQQIAPRAPFSVRRVVAALAALAALGACGGASAQNALYAGRIYSVGLDPRSIVALHLNDDGQPELITGNFVGNPTLSILFSAGGAAYIEGAAIGGSAKPLQLLAADMNGDGRDDLVTVHSSAVEVFIANGLSGLVPTASVDSGASTTRSGVAGDFNEDGRLDIATANEFSDTVSILLGDGAGGLAAPAFFPVDNILPEWNAQPHGIATGDFNEDGHLDLVTANYAYPSTLSVILGNGAGAFGPPTNFVMSSYAKWAGDSVVAADMNEDGHLDLITGGEDTIRFGDGTGAFGPPTFKDLTDNPRLIADVDEDGHLDQVYIELGIPRVARGDGHGGVTAIDSYPVGFMRALTLTDIDGDGHLDVACVSSTQSKGDVALIFNDGAGGFVRPPFTPLDAEPSRLTLGDLDNDGVIDVVTSNTAAESLSVALGDGAGGFGPATTIALEAQPSEVVIDDFNGDGLPDLAVAVVEAVSPYPGSVTVLFGDGAGAFPTSTVLPMTNGPSRVASGDLNGDGAPDLAAANWGNTVATWTWLGDGTGGFAAPTSWPFAKANGSDDPAVVALRDMNGDGRVDLVIGHNNAEQFSIRQGNGNGGLGPQVATPGLGYSLAIADLDGDGDPDVAGQRTAKTLAVRFFAAGAWSPVANYFDVKGTPKTGDIDGDGDVDLVVETAGPAFRCMVNSGSGGFLYGTAYQAGMSAKAFALGDLDGSGFPDVVAVGKGADPDLPPHVSVQASLTPSAWKNVGHALAGSNGVPQLVGKGTLQPNSPISLAITHGRPSGSAVLAIGSPAIHAPFKGGVFVPLPTLLIPGLPLDVDGDFTGAGTWYSSLLPGTTIYFQAWMADPAGPQGYSATNAIQGTTP